MFGKNFLELLEKNNKDTKFVAQALGVDEEVVYLWIAGEKEVPAIMAIKIAKLFGVTAESLFSTPDMTIEQQTDYDKLAKKESAGFVLAVLAFASAEQNISTCAIMQKFNFGYNRAVFFIESFEKMGVCKFDEQTQTWIVDDKKIRLWLGKAVGDFVRCQGKKDDDNCDKQDEAESVPILKKDVLEFMLTQSKPGVSALMIKYVIGYNRAGRILEYLKQNGVVEQNEAGKMTVNKQKTNELLKIMEQDKTSSYQYFD